MGDRASPVRIYIVYRDALFAQGMRSLLEWGQTGAIVGMETNVVKALTAIRALRPEVLIVQESTKGGQPSGLGMFLRQAVAPRIIVLSLDHEYATVCENSRISTRNPAEFASAILGDHRQQSLVPAAP
jgi:DNA-binding NarL/FixJ family response regulator